MEKEGEERGKAVREVRMVKEGEKEKGREESL
jgi:hypothetical protein